MKYILMTVFAATMFIACNSEAPADSATETEAPAEATTETVVADPNAKIDPVCEMVKDSTWTEYTVNGTDTVWFCSETCKTAYNSNPAKYNTKG